MKNFYEYVLVEKGQISISHLDTDPEHNSTAGQKSFLILADPDPKHGITFYTRERKI
jgi:hypothetical protein